MKYQIWLLGRGHGHNAWKNLILQCGPHCTA